jgi:hypothetical protein
MSIPADRITHCKKAPHGSNLKKYTRNEWERCEITLEMSGEDVKTTLETSVETPGIKHMPPRTLNGIDS